MRRRLLPAALAVLALATSAACTAGGSAPSAGASAVPVVRVAHVPSTLFAPLYVAEAKGYFKDEGLDVQLQKVKTGQDAVPLAGAGKVEVVAAGFSAGLFNAAAKGLNVKIAASMGASTGASPSPTTLEAAKKLVDSGELTRPEDLRGHKVAVAGGAGAAGGYQLAATLGQAGLGIDDVTVVNVAIPDMQGALANGAVSAAIAPAPFTTAMEEKGIGHPLAIPPQGTTASGAVFGGGFDATPAARKFLTALRKASADLQNGGAAREDVLAILAKATGQDIAVLRATSPYGWSPDLKPDEAQIAAQQATYAKAGLLDGAQRGAADLVASAAKDG